MAASNGSEYLELGIESTTNESVFARPSNAELVAEDEMELMWSAIQQLPSQKQSSTAILKSSDKSETIDVRKLDRHNCELVVTKGLATNDQFNHRLLFATKERLDRSTALLADSADLEWPPPMVVINTAVMEYYINAAGERTKDALRMFKHMSTSGVEPNAYTYALIIKALAAADLEKNLGFVGYAKKYFVEMLDRGMQPTEETYEAVLGGIGHGENKAKAEEERRDFVETVKAKGFVLVLQKEAEEMANAPPLKSEMKSLQGLLIKRDQKLVTLQRELEEAQKDKKSYLEEKNASSTKISKLTCEMKSLQGLLTERDQKLVTLQTELEEAKQQKKWITEEQEVSSTIISTLEDNIAKLKDENCTHQQQLEANVKRMRSLTTENKKLRTELLGEEENGLDWLIFVLKFGLEVFLAWLEFHAGKDAMGYLLLAIFVALFALFLAVWEFYRSCKKNEVRKNGKIRWGRLPWIPEIYSVIAIVAELIIYLVKIKVKHPAHVSVYTCCFHLCYLTKKLSLLHRRIEAKKKRVLENGDQRRGF